MKLKLADLLKYILKVSTGSKALAMYLELNSARGSLCLLQLLLYRRKRKLQAILILRASKSTSN